MKSDFTIKIEAGDVQRASPDDHIPDYYYDSEADELGSLLSDICEILQSSNVKFLVSGFGQDWPVDVNTDLVIIL